MRMIIQCYYASVLGKIVGEEQSVEYTAKAGFDAWDFFMMEMARQDWTNGGRILDSNHPLRGSHYLAFARKLKQIGRRKQRNVP